ncbi:flagellin N-terminal helical domain-containing protein [Clostridium sp.]|uniref:flagellin N-terminal helical domain-containing protein n=1 Tax=Clostridium sp. TaxID=1506 RepID=UPI002FDD9E3F
MRLNYNMPALTMNFIQNRALNRQSENLLRISSGYKVITAKDDPGALVKSENIRMQIGGLQSATKNVQDGVSMLQSAEGGLQEITNMIQRVRQLTVQAGGVTNENDRQIIQNEIDETLDGINSMANNTEFNGLKLLGKKKNLTMPIGGNSGESVTIPQIDLTNGSNSVISELYKVKTAQGKDILGEDNSDALDAIDGCLNTVLSLRSQYGALENRFQSTYDNMQALTDNMTSADSSIRDCDIAEEMMEYSKESIIIQSSTAMIVQANKLPQDVLEVLRNIK